MIDLEEMRYNNGCASCGYKEVLPGEPIGHIAVSRFIEKLDACFAKDDMPSAGRLIDYWYKEACSLRDTHGELSVVSEMLGYYRKTGEKEKGLWAVKRAEELVALTEGQGTVSGATVLLNAATTLKAFGQAEKALPLYETAGEIYRDNLDASDPRMGGFYNNYALALTDLGRYQEAEKYYFSALAVMEKAPGGIPDCASSYVNMAYLYEAWYGQEAEQIATCMDKAFALLDSAAVKRDSYYAFVCTKCAPAFDYFGYFRAAAVLKERAKIIYEGA